MNQSGLTPLGHAVLVRMLEESAHQGMIEIPEEIRARSIAMETRAEVIEVGSECWRDEKTPRASPGDIVLITKFAGFVARGPKDQRLYRLVNDRDVFCKVEGEGK